MGYGSSELVQRMMVEPFVLETFVVVSCWRSIYIRVGGDGSERLPGYRRLGFGPILHGAVGVGKAILSPRYICSDHGLLPRVN